MSFDFILRIWQPPQPANASLDYFRTLVISGIPVLWKPTKYELPVCMKTNQRKFGYTMTLDTSRLHKVAGSVNYPVIGFKGAYLDIRFTRFPRYPFPGLNNVNYEAKHYRSRCDDAYNSNGGRHLGEIQDYWPTYRKTELLQLSSSKHQLR